jgi:C-methyltransferase C-terminal domain
VIENHYFGAILDKKQFDTFYHEHPRTYSCTSFIHIAEALGMHIRKVEFPERYGGNIRVFMGTSKGDALQGKTLNEFHLRENDFGAKLSGLSSAIEHWKASKGADLQYEVARHGRLPAKAFPGRSAIPIKLLGLDEDMISAVYEKPDSSKIGHYVPGTRIPIRSDRDLSLQSNSPLINFAWHIAKEIKSYMYQRGYRGRIIDIISHTDFSPRP